jgi:LmbE family N-acetylglucosaminyl deacetylase
MKNILLLAAHDDDIILGASGAIQHYKKKQYIINVCIVTDSSSTQYKDKPELSKIRNKEYKKAVKFLGIDKVFNLKFTDMKLDQAPHHEINDSINKIFNKIKPEIIFTHAENDINNDHREVFNSTLVVTRPLYPFLKKLYSYEVLSSSEWNIENPFIPNTFLNIDKFLKKKQEALSMIKTEIKSYPHPRSIEGIKYLACYRGMQSGLNFAEAYKLIKNYE